MVNTIWNRGYLVSRHRDVHAWLKSIKEDKVSRYHAVDGRAYEDLIDGIQELEA